MFKLELDNTAVIPTEQQQGQMHYVVIAVARVLQQRHNTWGYIDGYESPMSSI